MVAADRDLVPADDQAGERVGVLEELLELCPRVLVFREGAVFAELAQPGMTMSSIIAAMFGGHDE